MEFILNEHCWEHIFSYLKPHDLVHALEVFQFWEISASREWRKITSILNRRYDSGAPVEIPAADAKKIITYAASYIELLNFDDDLDVFMLGNHYYKVEGEFRTATIVEVLISAGATKVSEVYFQQPPSAELLRSLMSNIEVKTLGYIHLRELHEDTTTDFGDKRPIHSSPKCGSIALIQPSDGHFPNCKTLELEIKATEFHCAHDMLSKILPYLRITSLQLTVYVVRGAEITYSNFGDIFGLLQLEKVTLHIKVYKDYFAGFVLNERFIKSLRTRCPKIRIMAMDFFVLDGSEKWYEVVRKEFRFVTHFGFARMEFSEVNHLSELKVVLRGSDLDVSEVTDAFKMMPKLKKLVLESDSQDISKTSQLQIVCDIVRVAVSLGKDVHLGYCNSGRVEKIFRVENKIELPTAKIRDEQCPILLFIFDFPNEQIFDGVKKFVQSELHNYKAFSYFFDIYPRE